MVCRRVTFTAICDASKALLGKQRVRGSGDPNRVVNCTAMETKHAETLNLKNVNIPINGSKTNSHQTTGIQIPMTPSLKLVVVPYLPFCLDAGLPWLQLHKLLAAYGLQFLDLGAVAPRTKVVARKPGIWVEVTVKI